MSRLIRFGGISAGRLSLGFVLIAMGAVVLWPFRVALIWAGVLAILSKPIHHGLSARFPRHPQLIPIPMILGWIFVLVGPVGWLMLTLQDEASLAYQWLSIDFSQQYGALKAIVNRIPLLGPMLVDVLQAFPREAHELMGVIKNLIPIMGRSLKHLVIGLSDQMLQLFTMVVALYFFIRDGHCITDRLQRGLMRMGIVDVPVYFGIIHATVYAVSLGIMGGALLQGFIATCGYLIFGVKTPLLLGLLSVIASLVPVLGASLVWGPLVFAFISENQLPQAVGLVLWGLLIVHPADNLLRPWVIGKLMHSPILLMILGVIGGILSFGLAGIFLGPCILSILYHAWNSFIDSEVSDKAE
ncbi:MAG: hypothetical protein RL333_85 [Pseudomonadota bacterium]|jgi:predicted PurR-regulated permease PerM